jgi:hypothetical protein
MKHSVDNVKMTSDAANLIGDVNNLLEKNKDTDDKLRDGMLDF